eukprot:11181037-Lingulodinium_polyedra.AAC.1
MARASADEVGLHEDLGERERRGAPACRSAEASTGEAWGSGVRTRVKVPSVCALAETKEGPGSVWVLAEAKRVPAPAEA